ncbi:hypothetical protein ROZALSC1DRAFT_26608 [Rozella allomycis CSF55]|uniref:mRNA guanylyltransferase n=1 Tax=Rozella allomycis (strain CSF55) TaxID=988480 RepID=A0A075AZF3_ROZAC|nr:Nucleic acid-binding domain-containing protein [Rozella allomycis CSF55]RKP22025.1 hypothetical protein ROZALSC1DRAFT_26608 [Rozella allomycis CSF55]|eukprot:EPZ35685.1 Nucleic acid-binding domain-containing protein [Rozella allomycis CSF55]
MSTHTLPDLDKFSHLVDYRESQVVLSFIKNKLELKRKNQFPGMQPVSMDKQNISFLLNEDYLVCEKSDGIRSLLVLLFYGGKPRTYLMDRKNEIRRAENIWFPTETSEFHNETIVDGEFVVDIEPGNIRRLRYLIFDCLMLCGQNVTSRNLLVRLGKAEVFIVKPIRNSKAYQANSPFGVYLKRMKKVIELQKQFDEVLPNLRHGNDGLIFTPVNEPYIFGTSSKVLKWKSPEMNTVDFIVTFDHEHDVYNLYCNQKGMPMFYAFYSPDDEFLDWVSHNNNESCIIECYFDKEKITKGFDFDKNSYYEDKGGWKFMRVRTDKDTPNDFSIVDKIIRSITHNITKDKLLKLQPVIQENWEQREESKHSTKKIKADDVS